MMWIPDCMGYVNSVYLSYIISMVLLVWVKKYPQKLCTRFAVCCIVLSVANSVPIFPHPSGLCQWHRGNLTVAPVPMGLLPDTQKCGLRMHRECRERFPRQRLQWKPLVSDPGMHHGRCVTHVPWCMSGSLTRGGGENVPGIHGAGATRNFMYLARGPWSNLEKHSIPNQLCTPFGYALFCCDEMNRSKWNHVIHHPYFSGLLHWHCGNMIAEVTVRAGEVETFSNVHMRQRISFQTVTRGKEWFSSQIGVGGIFSS